ncbi:hypothetical protein KSP40_PGU016658 [Platanthera guangdongensis]|uniref:Uncharacterized protein n=1 Tax=Platanthera guangdongensis TaxID=2320717 RepID=A0ABR2MDC6_9ASPA
MHHALILQPFTTIPLVAVSIVPETTTVDITRGSQIAPIGESAKYNQTLSAGQAPLGTTLEVPDPDEPFTTIPLVAVSIVPETTTVDITRGSQIAPIGESAKYNQTLSAGQAPLGTTLEVPDPDEPFTTIPLVAVSIVPETTTVDITRGSQIAPIGESAKYNQTLSAGQAPLGTTLEVPDPDEPFTTIPLVAVSIVPETTTVDITRGSQIAPIGESAKYNQTLSAGQAPLGTTLEVPDPDEPFTTIPLVAVSIVPETTTVDITRGSQIAPIGESAKYNQTLSAGQAPLGTTLEVPDPDEVGIK